MLKKVLILSSAAIMFLSGCSSAQVVPLKSEELKPAVSKQATLKPKQEEQPVTETKPILLKPMKINFFSDKPAVTLKYKDKSGKDFKTKDMENGGNGWYNITIESLNPEFSFVIDKKSYNLGGVLGEYPGDAKQPFRTSYPEIWVKNGLIFTQNPDLNNTPQNEFRVISINLHTYQETEQAAKLGNIAKAINDFNPDVVAFQECAQDKDSPVVIENHYGVKIRKDNMAYIITGILKEKYSKDYEYFWDWHHYGWDKWEEGCAVLTKHKLLAAEGKFVSNSTSQSFWKSRKVEKIVIEKEGYGKIAVYSAHMGWWDDSEEPFKVHFDNLLKWQNTTKNDEIATFTMGDFNIEAGSKGYDYIKSTGTFIDQYVEANPDGLLDSTIGGMADGWKRGEPDGKRIDFIFTRKNDKLKIKTAQRIFTENVYGRVSDHVGVYAIFDLTK